MNDYARLRKQNKSRVTSVAALALCVVVSACMLFGRLVNYTAADTCQYIPLTQSNGITHVTAVDGGEAVRLAPDSSVLMSPVVLTQQKPGFEVYDENTVWSGETVVEIFRVSYDNENGEVTVHSRGGDKVLAPGTGNTYEFALENTGNVSLDYTMSMEAYFSNDELPIPVDVRVTDYQGNYLAGSAESKADVMQLNEVQQSDVVAAGNIYPYTLEWEWPYESGNDEYDTMLGNLAVEEDISLTIVIKTTATCDEDPKNPGGIPQTGDTNDVGMLMTVLVLSVSGFFLTVMLLRKDEQDEKA